MGYYSNLYGELEIDPPLTWGELGRDPKWMDTEDGMRSFVIEVDEDSYETSEGVTVRKSGIAIVPAYDDSVKAYDAKETLQGIVNTWPDREYRGDIRREGEAPGDISRYRVIDGKVVEEQALLTWPDGTEVT